MIRPHIVIADGDVFDPKYKFPHPIAVTDGHRRLVTTKDHTALLERTYSIRFSLQPTGLVLRM